MTQEQKSTKKLDQTEQTSPAHEILSLLLYIVIVFGICFLIITFVGQRSRVSGSSMEPTLSDGDNLIVDKISYRLHDPERFDIVVFPYRDSDVFYIKRVIGLPGETVRIDEEGNIYINGEILEENYGLETIDSRHIGRAIEEVKLGKDEYFVMGDNRNNSKDSRFEEVGNIKRSEIDGKAVFRIWPLSKIGRIK